ncbi:MAG: hypothetical protein PHT69_08500 [Bacteroidales bacterium]|nr:hypothetical protein [Bacteroidales bacterium]
MNHIQTFSELNSEKVRFLLSEKFPYRDVLSLVKEVNTRIIYENVTDEQLHIYTKNFNYKAFGFKGKNDFKLTTSAGDKPEFKNISVTPVCYYSLHDNFTLAPPPDVRSKIIVGLLADEFERIKLRAIYTFETSNDENQVKMYARKNRQFIKTCFHNHKATFHDLFTLNPNYLHHPESYIYFYINFFLIKLRLFYEKFFIDFLGPGKKNEKQLLAELFQVNPALMYKQNDAISPSIKEEHNTNFSETAQQHFATGTSLAMAYQAIAKENNITAENLKLLLSLVGKIKWNGYKNTLADYILQLMETKSKDGLSLLETTPDDISSLLSIVAIDKDGYMLSKETIKTLLQPSKSAKRPKDGAKGKVNIKI